MRENEKTPSILKQAIQVNNKPFPWLKAFLAGVAAAHYYVRYGLAALKIY